MLKPRVKGTKGPGGRSDGGRLRGGRRVDDLARKVCRHIPHKLRYYRRVEVRPAVADYQRPEPERPRVSWSEFRGRREQDEVLERSFGEQGSVHGAQRTALGLPEEADLLCARDLPDLLDRAMHV